MKIRYYASIVVFLASLALLLLAAVDICRGFLFKSYYNIGSPSALFHLNIGHLPMILVGACGVLLSYYYWTRAESRLLRSKVKLQSASGIIAAVIAVFLVIDLFIYRGVGASRILNAGKMGAGPGTLGISWVIPVHSFPGWLQPAGDAISYVLVNWQATLLGLLVGALFVVAGVRLLMRMKGNGFMAHLLGAAMAVPQPFCACCASPVGAAMYSRGADIGPVMAFVVSAPMLNITSLILASALLPAKYAVLRIAGGVIVGVLVTYLVSLLASRWVSREDNGSQGKENWAFRWAANLVSFYERVFRFETLMNSDSTISPSKFISSCVKVFGRIAMVVVPLFVVGAVVADYILQVLPTSANNLTGVVTMSFFSTLFMTPTWTEIPIASGLLQHGLSGPAAVALIALPAINMPAMLVIGGAVRSWKVSLILAFGVFAASIVAGVIFL